jgi:pre-mRNA-processing factor 19
VDFDLHPSGSYLITASLDSTWAFYDIANGTKHSYLLSSSFDIHFNHIYLTCLNKGACIESVPSPSDAAASPYHSLSVHPDGLLLGTGTASGLVHVWDMKVPKKGKNKHVQFSFFFFTVSVCA